MGYQQLVQPNLSVVGQSDECLVYVREIFGVAAKYPTAIAAWTAAQYPHSGEQPPTDVAGPVWFSYGTQGHVACSVNGSKFYSVTAQGDQIFDSIQDLMDYIGGGIEYLGWSEDINSVRVVQPQGEGIMNANGVTVVIQAAFRRAPTVEELSYWTGQSFDVCLDNLATTSEYQEISSWIAASEANTNPATPTVLASGLYKVN